MADAGDGRSAARERDLGVGEGARGGFAERESGQDRERGSCTMCKRSTF